MTNLWRKCPLLLKCVIWQHFLIKCVIVSITLIVISYIYSKPNKFWKNVCLSHFSKSILFIYFSGYKRMLLTPWIIWLSSLLSFPISWKISFPVLINVCYILLVTKSSQICFIWKLFTTIKYFICFTKSVIPKYFTQIKKIIQISILPFFNTLHNTLYLIRLKHMYKIDI